MERGATRTGMEVARVGGWGVRTRLLLALAV